MFEQERNAVVRGVGKQAFHLLRGILKRRVVVTRLFPALVIPVRHLVNRPVLVRPTAEPVANIGG